MSAAHTRHRDAEGLPPALPHLRHIARSWQQDTDAYTAKLMPGEYYVTTNGEAITTVLGSCVSACIRDSRTGMGGMNHFMLPLDASQGQSAWTTGGTASTRYGNVAMELLINDLLKLGARRENLEVKLAGGGRVLQAMSTDIGKRNIEFVRDYVRNENLRLIGEDLGDVYPRRVQYFPDSGRIRIKKLKGAGSSILSDRERLYMDSLEKAPSGGDVEMF